MPINKLNNYKIVIASGMNIMNEAWQSPRCLSNWDMEIATLRPLSEFAMTGQQKVYKTTIFTD